MGARCLLSGNITIDDLVFHDGRVRMGILGGDAVYSALGASIWVEKVMLSAVAGPDYPVQSLAELYGFDVSCVTHKAKLSLRNWGLYEKDGTRQFIFRNESGQWAEYSPEPSDLPPAILEGAFFHCAPMPWEKQIALVRYARQCGAKFISLDPPFQFMEAMSMTELAEGLNFVDAFLPSRQEVASLFPGLSPDKALDVLIRDFPHLKAIVIKLGENGAIGYDGLGKLRFSIPAYKARIVDPTGAGDSFCGGFLAGYMKTGEVKAAVMHGVVSASFVVETEGTFGMNGISLAKAQERLEEMIHNY
ncbi:MAG: carbohydrate kinase family protein [Spirochaetales bacterium]